MSLDPELLKIIVCPRDRTPLKMADDALLTRVNEAIADNQVCMQNGEVCASPISAGLLNADGSLLYRIEDGVPVLLIEEAIVLEQLES